MTKSELDKIRHAIITIHNNANYYKGMEILCKLVEWDSYIGPNKYYSAGTVKETKLKMNRWVMEHKANY